MTSASNVRPTQNILDDSFDIDSMFNKDDDHDDGNGGHRRADVQSSQSQNTSGISSGSSVSVLLA